MLLTLAATPPTKRKLIASYNHDGLIPAIKHLTLNWVKEKYLNTDPTWNYLNYSLLFNVIWNDNYKRWYIQYIGLKNFSGLEMKKWRMCQNINDNQTNGPTLRWDISLDLMAIKSIADLFTLLVLLTVFLHSHT